MQRGFSVDDVRAICTVDHSTKKGSQDRIGNKGARNPKQLCTLFLSHHSPPRFLIHSPTHIQRLPILVVPPSLTLLCLPWPPLAFFCEHTRPRATGLGFKSVFMLSDTPQVHSNNFHFGFDAREPLGFVLPTDEASPPGWQAGTGTRIHLPLKREHDAESVVAMVQATLTPHMLLFLRRIHRVEVHNDCRWSLAFSLIARMHSSTPVRPCIPHPHPHTHPPTHAHAHTHTHALTHSHTHLCGIAVEPCWR